MSEHSLMLIKIIEGIREENYLFIAPLKYVRKTDSKWLMDAMKNINKINAYIPEKKFQKRWINYYQEKLEKEHR